ncbi:GINS complex subunit 4 [Blastomyces dermatitidis ER-3]|uniref:DNA replication complex GINS protein SLD5 n=1 Tax=Ajellomyces dermatitidis (strain ER-3 / ATCC MYA-2586) TaxID=559297 RepID=A0ABP2F637_AJEDR|nr:GINS complex subunit 4 [Blastomyces dermatitidis ER-3]EEQ92565.1 GINS complex subunit 4 [Blastomyces dermatitidis ER-3]
MDIDDILASVDRPDFTSPEAAALDAQQLTRFWVTERGVPELLPWPGPLMERVMERVRRQIEKIEDLTAAASDPSATNPSTNPTTNLKLSILQTDLSRTQYIIRSLLRQRLSKLTKHSLHYLLLSTPLPSSSVASSQSHEQSSQATFNTPTPTHPHRTATNAYKSSTTDQHQQPLLSPQESAFLQTHQSLLTAHYNNSFLSTFPAQLRRLDDNAGGTTMIQGPETKEVVFVRCLVDEVRIVIPSGEGDGMGGDGDVYGRRMRWGEVWIARWEGVKEAWARGEVEVL